MIYHVEIHFTTLYMADLGTRAEPLGEGARVEKGDGKERQKPLWRREGMQHVRTAYLFLLVTAELPSQLTVFDGTS
jgi:hypothetical protein